jgi:hypothetical protein
MAARCATILVSQAAASQSIAGKAAFNPPPSRLARNASRSGHTPGTRIPHECPPAFRGTSTVAGTGSAKRRSVRPPIAIAPVRFHVRCCASRAKARRAGHADLGGLTPPHNHGRPIGSQDDCAVVLALLASLGWRQPGRGLLRIVTIGSSQLNSERNPATVANQMTFAAHPGSVGGIRSRLQPPKTARIELPSTTARDQSVLP